MSSRAGFANLLNSFVLLVFHQAPEYYIWESYTVFRPASYCRIGLIHEPLDGLCAQSSYVILLLILFRIFNITDIDSQMEPGFSQSAFSQTISSTSCDVLPYPGLYTSTVHPISAKPQSHCLPFSGDLYECGSFMLSCARVFYEAKRAALGSSTGTVFFLPTKLV